VRKLIIDLDPGIGDALAAIVALVDPAIDLLALTACAGAVPGPVASRNLQAIVAHVDPPKWPRLGSSRAPAPEVEQVPGLWEPWLGGVHGPTGLGDLEFPAAQLHNPHESPRVLVELVRAHPHEITLLTLGPLTNIAAATELAPEFPGLLAGLVVCGGALTCGGDVTAAAESNLFLDAEAAQRVLSLREIKTLVPLDATARVMLDLEQYVQITAGDSAANRFLRRLLPVSFRTHRQLLGMEGLRLAEVAALLTAIEPGCCRTQPLAVTVETQGEQTRGAVIADRWAAFGARPNAEVVWEIDPAHVLRYLAGILGGAA
jgi:inosine-uridine nucleoside N-ribohydrolase